MSYRSPIPSYLRDAVFQTNLLSSGHVFAREQAWASNLLPDATTVGPPVPFDGVLLSQKPSFALQP